MSFFTNIYEIWKQLSQYEWIGNNLSEWFKVLGVILFALIFIRFFAIRISSLIYSLFKQFSFDVPVKDCVNLLRKPVSSLLYLLVIYWISEILHFPASWKLAPVSDFGIKMLLLRLYTFLFIINVFWICFRVIDFFALVLLKKSYRQNARLQEHLVPFIKQLSKIILAIICIFSILGIVFKLNVGSIITGLGIGGLAVALAGKETLENLLATVAIFIDKPFVSGDLIKVDTIVGNIETVGFRSTTIRTIDKSLLTIPNKQLIDKPVENLSKRMMHRVKQTFTFDYNLSIDQIKEIVQIINQTLGAFTFTTHFKTAFLDNFGNSGYEITVIYTVNAVEYEEFWPKKESVNLAIAEILKSKGYTFVYPTSKLLLENQS